MAPSQAWTQPLPNWNPREVCKSEMDRDVCVALEKVAYSDLSGYWPTIADKLKRPCLDEADKLNTTSYRALLNCIERKSTQSGRIGR